MIDCKMQLKLKYNFSFSLECKLMQIVNLIDKEKFYPRNKKKRAYGVKKPVAVVKY